VYFFTRYIPVIVGGELPVHGLQLQQIIIQLFTYVFYSKQISAIKRLRESIIIDYLIRSAAFGFVFVVKFKLWIFVCLISFGLFLKPSVPPLDLNFDFFTKTGKSFFYFGRVLSRGLNKH